MSEPTPDVPGGQPEPTTPPAQPTADPTGAHPGGQPSGGGTPGEHRSEAAPGTEPPTAHSGPTGESGAPTGESGAPTGESSGTEGYPQPGRQPQYGQAEPHGLGDYPRSGYAPGYASAPNYPTTPNYPSYGTAEHTAPVHSNLPHHAEQQRPSRRGLVASVLIALLAGLIGGLIGGNLVNHGSSTSSESGSPNALDSTAPATTTQPNLPPGSVEQVAQKLLPSVVSLQFTSTTASGEGSGVILSGDGMILTNNHVIEAAAQGAKLTAEFQDGRTSDVRIVGRAPDADLAVVQAVGVSGLTPAELGSSSHLVVGQQVLAIGSPFQLSGTVTSGIVSALERPARVGGENGDQSTVLDTVQTDAAINPGNSGGPLVDMQGRVIAINSAIYSPNSGGLGQQQGGSVGVGFAIPIDQARRIADELRRTGRATMAVLNVSVRPDGPAQVVQVVPGGPGDRAGVKTGDVVVKVGDRRVENGDGLIAAVRSHAPGETVKLALTDSAGGNPHTVDVTLGSQDIGAR